VPDPVRYHLDEHIDPDIALALRAHGIDVTTTIEQGLQSSDDEHHFRRARSEGRVIVTDDTDFLRLASVATDHPGIVFCRRNQHSMGEIIQFLLLVHGVYEASEMHSRIEFV
jgi:predicted nuclease of predicted toxin-antitoxin system